MNGGVEGRCGTLGTGVGWEEGCRSSSPGRQGSNENSRRLRFRTANSEYEDLEEVDDRLSSFFLTIGAAVRLWELEESGGGVIDCQ